MNTKHHQAIHTFNSKARWNLFGSAIYECLRIAHNTILALLFTPQVFGLVGSLFASTFLVVRVSDAGATNALLPFFGYLEASRQKFKSLFIKRLLFPLFITAPLGACLASLMLYKTEHTTLMTYALILPLLIFSETLRSFLRQFLHLAGRSRQTVLIDQVAFVLYLLICWPALYLFPDLRTPIFIFTLFLVDSLAGLCTFLIMTYRFAQQLPEEPSEGSPTLPPNFYSVRFYAWLMRVSKEVFSSNALTPLFAATVGLKQAGLFYFAASLAMALYAIMRSVIGHAGAHFFISAKKIDIPTPHAFKVVSQKLSAILLVLTTFFVLSYYDILQLTNATAATSQLAIFFILYFSIVVIEFGLFLYEQQYTLEQSNAKALQWRLLELLLVYVTARGLVILNPISALTCILLAKVGTLVALALSGYRRWGILLSFHMPWSRVGILVAIGALLSLLLKGSLYVLHFI